MTALSGIGNVIHFDLTFKGDPRSLDVIPDRLLLILMNISSF